MSGTKYASGGVKVSIGAESLVELKPRIFRGRLTGMLFESDKAFLLPSAMPGIQGVKAFYDSHPKLEVLVSGHADREGPESYNLDLSNERAQSIEAFLQDKVDDWMPWYGAGKPASKRWGVREDQYMLSLLCDGSAKPYYAGTVTGRSDDATKSAVSRFRADNGLGAGNIDDATRRKLVEKYMATDNTTLPAGTTLKHHGCGEFHPALKTADGVGAAENRRVEIFLFEGPIDPAPPGRCPAGGCTQYPEWVKRTVDTVDFNVHPEVTILVVDEIGLPLKGAAVKIKFANGTEESAMTDDEGKLKPRVTSGEQLTLTIEDAHDAQAGDGMVTPSGKHFGAGADGPPK